MLSFSYTFLTIFFCTNQWSDPHSANNVGSEKSATLLFLFALLRYYRLQANQIYIDSYGAILLSSFFKPPEGIDCYPAPGPFQPCNDLFDWWSLRCGMYSINREKGKSRPCSLPAMSSKIKPVMRV